MTRFWKRLKIFWEDRRRNPRLFGVHAKPTPRLNIGLAMLPFLLLVGVYLIGSHIRLSANPDDKFLPSVPRIVTTAARLAFSKDPRTGQYLMLQDTVVSLRRMGAGIAAAAATGLFFGLNMGLFPGMNALLRSFVTFISIIPPLAILPILLVVFGVDELAKVMLIFFGTFGTISLSLYFTTVKIPREQITKALTLGASQLQVAYFIVLPQVMPRVIEAARLSLGAAWLFLIAAEAIASRDGLGYRIYLFQRYLLMDAIIPYVLWITFVGFMMDWFLKRFMTWRYPWYFASRES